MKYILNSAVITGFGEFVYVPQTPEQATAFIPGAESTIGYQATADALSELTGRPVALNRVQIKMQPGDQALVFRLTCRLDDPAMKGKLSAEFVRGNCEIGLLTRTK